LRVVFGRPFERIVEMAVKEEVELIVMGTHGRTGFARLALGSVAERVVRLAPCSVLTVKAPTTESESWLQEFYSDFLGGRRDLTKITGPGRHRCLPGLIPVTAPNGKAAISACLNLYVTICHIE